MDDLVTVALTREQLLVISLSLHVSACIMDNSPSETTQTLSALYPLHAEALARTEKLTAIAAERGWA
jgi:hypothetical protein